MSTTRETFDRREVEHQLQNLSDLIEQMSVAHGLSGFRDRAKRVHQGITKAIEPTNVVKLDCLRTPPALKVIDGDLSSRIDEPNEAACRDLIGKIFAPDTLLVGFRTINHALPADCEPAGDQPPRSA